VTPGSTGWWTPVAANRSLSSRRSRGRLDP
jgi:hypothetical protein